MIIFYTPYMMIIYDFNNTVFPFILIYDILDISLIIF